MSRPHGATAAVHPLLLLLLLLYCLQDIEERTMLLSDAVLTTTCQLYYGMHNRMTVFSSGPCCCFMASAAYAAIAQRGCLQRHTNMMPLLSHCHSSNSGNSSKNKSGSGSVACRLSHYRAPLSADGSSRLQTCVQVNSTMPVRLKMCVVCLPAAAAAAVC